MTTSIFPPNKTPEETARIVQSIRVQYYVPGLVAKREGPYRGIQFDETVSFETPDGTRTFRVLTYQAYDAFGLIGSECNGIVILDEDGKHVLCDEIAKQSSGYNGASPEQIIIARSLVDATWAEFRDVININPRTRYEI